MKQYIREKVKVYRDAGVRFNQEQITYMHGLRNEVQVDNYTKDFLFPKVEPPRPQHIWCGNI